METYTVVSPELSQVPAAVTKPKYAYITSLRGLAILGVMLVHVSQFGAQVQFLRPLQVALLANGARGVQLFFVASALTLYLSMSNRRGEEKNPKINFFLRRFFRIAPLYYLGILYYGAIVPVHDGLLFSPAEYVSNLLFLNWLSPYYINHLVPGGWSIAVEFAFYAMLPWLFPLVRNLNQAVKFLVFTLLFNTFITYVLRHVQLATDTTKWVEFLFYYFPSQLPVFATGIVLYFLILTKQRYLSARTLLLGAFVVLCSFSTDTSIEVETGLPYLPKHFFFAIGFLLLAWSLSIKQFWLLVNPVTHLIGRLSFSLYLGHFTVLYFMDKYHVIDPLPPTGHISALLNLSIRFLVVLFFSLGLAWILERCIEIPGQKLGQRVIAYLEK
ncbi:acyltransferase family protein [Hymenobacter norwichensis]|uniref:acyltransferase family protein n=1 Tax=Hymenobacter norwichensis TaxID=223903 RepID=UPI0003B760C3|nr:acyltransferase [Hymenobacter norwichensis]